MNNENGARISGCCNDTDMCNVNLLQIGEYNSKWAHKKFVMYFDCSYVFLYKCEYLML